MADKKKYTKTLSDETNAKKNGANEDEAKTDTDGDKSTINEMEDKRDLSESTTDDKPKENVQRDIRLTKIYGNIERRKKRNFKLIIIATSAVIIMIIIASVSATWPVNTKGFDVLSKTETKSKATYGKTTPIAVTTNKVNITQNTISAKTTVKKSYKTPTLSTSYENTSLIDY